MNKKYNYLKMILVMSLLVIIAIPYILQIDFVKNLVLDWLSFSVNSDYKIAYVQIIGSIVGTFLSVYGALFIQNEQQKNVEEKRKQECARKIYIELRTCFSELQSIYKDTKLTYKLNEIKDMDDVEKFCDTAIGRKLSLNKNWVENLAGSGDIYSDFDVTMIYKYYFKLQVIQQAFETRDVEEIKKIYVQYICWFITSNGNDVHEDIEHFMKRMDEMTKA